MNFLKDLIFNGKIPHIRIIRKVLWFMWVVPVLFYLFSDVAFREYGKLGWAVLVGVMLIRPLADVLPDLKILKALVPLRKEFGILSGALIFIHGYASFAMRGKNIFIQMFQAGNHWDFTRPNSWGLLGFILVIILLLTSNNFSIRLLKGAWKKVQQLAYLFFLFGGIHIALVKKDEVITLIPLIIVLVLWLLARFNVRLRFFKPD